MNQKGEDVRPTAHPSSLERWAPLGWAIVAILVVLEAGRRLVTGDVPPDLSAYIAAADVFARGENPYGPALFESAHYGGFVYLYPPGTLPLIEPLTLIPPRLIAAFDALLRTALIALALGWVRRALEVDLPLPWLVLAAMFYEPFLADFMAGNLASYMFAAFIASMWMGHDEPRLWHAFAALGLGVVLAFKPMWGLPAGLVLLVRGRWKMAAGLVAGAGFVAGLSLVEWTGDVLIDSWLARIESVRAQYRSVDLLSLAPALLPAAVIVWLGAGLALVRRRGTADPWVWLWTCVSIFAWPRLGSYSYVLVIPALCFLWTRWGWRRAMVLALPALGPLPWMLRASGWDYYHRALLFGWIWLVAAFVFVALLRDQREEAPRGREVI